MESGCLVSFLTTTIDLILSQIQKRLKKGHKSDFLGHHHDDRYFPSTYGEESCKFTGILQVWDTAVGPMGLSLGSHCSELLVEKIGGKSLPLVDTCLLWLKPEAPPGFRATSGNTLDEFLGAPLAVSCSPGSCCVELLSRSLLWIPPLNPA